MVDDVTVSHTPPSSQSEPQICLSLTIIFFFKRLHKPLIYKQDFLEITPKHETYNFIQIFTDGSKVDEKVATAVMSSVVPIAPSHVD